MLVVLGLIGFLLLNLFAYYRVYRPKRNSVLRARTVAEQTLKSANDYLELKGQRADEIDWLAKHEPKPAAVQEVDSALQKFAQEEAIKASLTVKRQKPQTAERPEGATYHRARIEFEVTGTEAALYLWLDKLQSPPQFRAVTSLRLTPQRDDDTKVDCTVVIEQWFVPQPLDA